MPGLTQDQEQLIFRTKIIDGVSKSIKSHGMEPTPEMLQWWIESCEDAFVGNYSNWIKQIHKNNPEAIKNVTTNMDGWLYNKNVSALVEQLDEVTNEKFPFKAVASAEGETIEIKFSNLITGSSETVRFYRMWTTDPLTGARTGEQYGWEIQYPGEPAKEVTQVVWESEYKKYKALAEQKENWNPLDDDLTGGGKAEEGYTANELIEVVKKTTGLDDPLGINKIMGMVMSMVMVAMFVGVFILIGYLIYKAVQAYRQKQALKEQPPPEAPYVGSYAQGGEVPATGYAYVHKGEQVIPSTDVHMGSSLQSGEEGFWKGRAVAGKALHYTYDVAKGLNNPYYALIKYGAKAAVKRDPDQTRASTRLLVKTAKVQKFAYDKGEQMIPIAGPIIPAAKQALGMTTSENEADVELALSKEEADLMGGAYAVGAKAAKTQTARHLGKAADAKITQAQLERKMKKLGRESDDDFMNRVKAKNEVKKAMVGDAFTHGAKDTAPQDVVDITGAPLPVPPKRKLEDPEHYLTLERLHDYPETDEEFWKTITTGDKNRDIVSLKLQYEASDPERRDVIRTYIRESNPPDKAEAKINMLKQEYGE